MYSLILARPEANPGVSAVEQARPRRLYEFYPERLAIGWKALTHETDDGLLIYGIVTVGAIPVQVGDDIALGRRPAAAVYRLIEVDYLSRDARSSTARVVGAWDPWVTKDWPGVEA